MRTFKKIIGNFLDLVDTKYQCADKLCGCDKIILVDETAFNFKTKSHRGRTSVNKTDTLCIVGVTTTISRALLCCLK